MKINYIYNAIGVKLKKVVTDTSVTPAAVTTDYLTGFQYLNSALEFFPTAEGYVKNTVSAGVNNYTYVFNYTDNLGNVRLSYAKDPSDNVLKILEENHYYPFGLKHTGYNATQSMIRSSYFPPVVIVPVVNQNDITYRYKYNGKELQDELGLNTYDYGARNYDPAIGRWMNIDPLAEQSRRWSPYAYAMNNPVYFIDPDGMHTESSGNTLREEMSEEMSPSRGMDKFRMAGKSFQVGEEKGMDMNMNEIGTQDNINGGDTGKNNGGNNNKNNGGDKGTGGDKPSLEDLKKGPPKHPDYKSPRGGDRKVKNPNGQGTGWIDNKGRVWVPTDHKGTHAPHWDRENPDGTHTNVYPSTNPISEPAPSAPPTMRPNVNWTAVGIGVGIIVIIIATDGLAAPLLAL